MLWKWGHDVFALPVSEHKLVECQSSSQATRGEWGVVGQATTSCLVRAESPVSGVRWLLVA